MKFYIIETKKTEELTLIDSESGLDNIADYIGNTGAFLEGREFSNYDEEKGAFVCHQSDFEWWQVTVEMQQELDYKIQKLVAEHGTDAVYKALYNVGDNDLRDDITVKDNALDEVERRQYDKIYAAMTNQPLN